MSAPPTTTAEHRVQLDAYAGPLDLLLYLVKRHEIDLQDIPMAELVEQYLAHLRVIETIDVEKAGEFLVMAASLVEIKSQMLVPRPAEDDGEGDESEHPDADPVIDPRFELVQQLLAYKRFKDAANHLEARAAEWDARFPVHARAGEQKPEEEPDETDAPLLELDLEDVNVLDLCAAFGRVMDSIGHLGDHEVTYDDTPISLHAEDIVDRLQRDGGPRKSMSLPDLFLGRSRSEMIGLFLATLELVRQRKVKVAQGESVNDIALELQPESAWEITDIDAPTGEPQASPDWRDPDTGEVQYDWPDEETRQRAQRRERFRKTWEQKQADDADEPQDEDESADSFDTRQVVEASDGFIASVESEKPVSPVGEAGGSVAEEVDEFSDARDPDASPPRPAAD